MGRKRDYAHSRIPHSPCGTIKFQIKESMGSMKRKFLLCLSAVLCSASLFTGCGSTGTASTDSLADYSSLKTVSAYSVSSGNISTYVKLGKYKGISLNRSTAAVTDEQALSYARIKMKPEKVTSASAVLQKGDTAVISYTGSVDNVTLSDLTSDNYDLVIGSGNAIDGFEDGLVGMKAGESRDLHLTFPSDYKESDVAGKAVVFHVTLKELKRTPALDDNWVKNHTDFKTVKEYTKDCKKVLEESNKKSAEKKLNTLAWDTVKNTSTFLVLPSGYVEEGEKKYENIYKMQALSSNLSLDAYLKKSGTTKEDYQKAKEKYGKDDAADHLLVDALEKELNMSPNDATYQKLLKKTAKSYGMDEQTLYDTYGKDEITQSIMKDRISSWIVKNAKITDTTE